MNMAILKRFEIWLLLGLMTGALVFALKPDPPEGLAAEDTEQVESPEIAESPSLPAAVETEEPTETEPLFRVEKVTVTPTQQGKIVDLTLFGQAEGSNPVDFNTDTNVISVMTESGDAVERFFLPFPQPAVMDAEERSMVSLKYWLRDDDTKILWVNIFNHKLKAELPE